MKQLESDGLLQDDTSGRAGEQEEEAGKEQEPTAKAEAVPPSDAGTSSQGTGAVPTGAASLSADEQAAAAAAADQDQGAMAWQGEELQQHEGQGEQEMTEGGTEAEQKVLGYLTQEPQWSKVGAPMLGLCMLGLWVQTCKF